MQTGQQPSIVGVRRALQGQLRLLQTELRGRERQSGATELAEVDVILAGGEETPLLFQRQLNRVLGSFPIPSPGFWVSDRATGTTLSPAQQQGFKAPPEPCAFLQLGQRFEGRQRVKHGSKGEHWNVTVTIQGVTHAMGHLCGTLEAYNIPDSERPVTTFFEGEIVDNVNHTFFTSEYGACIESDLRHWSRFKTFQALRREVMASGGRHSGLARHRHVYMRWKERFFVEGCECRLTIAGFYYLCLDRITGAIEGLYFDPSSTPDQQLTLEPQQAAGDEGLAFGHVDIA
ncbi:hypothetical protein ACKKBF_B21100 [Auxenochlorella protothecoides x Auxenochlorella symbiontica]